MLPLFVVSALWLAWAYTLYPLWMWGRARVAPRLVRPVAAPSLSVSVIVPARDEERVLGRKLESLLAQPAGDGPREIIVVDDGSRDATADIAASFAARGVRLVRLARPSGKAVALNAGARAARGDVLVLTDARQPLVPGALAALLEPLGDPAVGAVSGCLSLAVDGGGLGLYRRLDDALRRHESATGSQVGVTGALWALRAWLWEPLPAGLLVDDLLAPLVVARGGLRVVAAPAAGVVDAASPDPSRELQRRVRTLAGNLEMIRVAPWVLSPRDNPLLLRLVGHKLSRLGAPLALVGLALSNAALALAPRGAFAHALLSSLLGAQILAYALAALAPRLPRRGVVSSLARASRAFVFLHVAAALALWRFARGDTRALWREAPATEARA